MVNDDKALAARLRDDELISINTVNQAATRIEELSGQLKMALQREADSQRRHDEKVERLEAENKRLRRDHKALAKQLDISERKLKAVTKLWYASRAAFGEQQ